LDPFYPLVIVVGVGFEYFHERAELLGRESFLPKFVGARATAARCAPLCAGSDIAALQCVAKSQNAQGERRLTIEENKEKQGDRSGCALQEHRISYGNNFFLKRTKPGRLLQSWGFPRDATHEPY
jgi:hypothetical protein